MSALLPAPSILGRPPAFVTGSPDTVARGNMGVGNAIVNATEILSGALTANVYQEILAVTGPGVLNFLNFYTKDITARTIAAKLVLDGVTVFEKTGLATANNNLGAVLHGATLDGSSLGPIPEGLPFRSSLSLQVRSSLTETNTLAAAVNYWTS